MPAPSSPQMGCSNGVAALALIKDIMNARKNVNVLFVCTETVTPACYNVSGPAPCFVIHAYGIQGHTFIWYFKVVEHTVAERKSLRSCRAPAALIVARITFTTVQQWICAGIRKVSAGDQRHLPNGRCRHAAQQQAGHEAKGQVPAATHRAQPHGRQRRRLQVRGCTLPNVKVSVSVSVSVRYVAAAHNARP